MSETVLSHHLIARHAGSALWLARYMERIENLARLLDVTKTFARDAEGGRNWMSLLRINGDAEGFFAKYDAPGIGPGAPRDDIHHRRFAGAIGADHRTHLARFEDQR